MEGFISNFGLYVAYIMIIAAVLSAVVFPVIYLVQDPKKAKGSLIGVLGLAVLFVISYLISGDELYRNLENPTVSKLVGGGIIMFYIMFALSILAAIYSTIARIFK